MRGVVQKTSLSRVVINKVEKASINKGLMVLLGVKKSDNTRDAEYIVDKVLNLRIFEDENGKMNRSILDIGGDLLLVSQFTLYGDARKGRRPSFSDAADPEPALDLFDYSVKYARSRGVTVETGVFGANMDVHIINEGPCTILLDSERNF